MALLFIVFLQLTFVAFGVLMCFIEDDCAEGYKCIDGTCTKCLTCSLLYRKGNSCTLDFQECGGCLEGYEEISVTDFSTALKPCTLMKKDVKSKECTSNTGCPPNNYCREESCFKCFDCAVVNRFPPVDKCAKGLNECGSCMDGYTEVAITTDTNYKRCEKANFITYETPPWDTSLATYTSISALLLVPVVFFTLFFVIRIRKSISGTNMHKTISQSQFHPSAPPLYVMDLSHETERCNLFVSQYKTADPTVALFENEQMQQARMFKEPDAPYYPKGGDGDVDETPAGNNSCTHPTSCAAAVAADSTQQQAPHFSGASFTNRFDGLGGQDVVDQPMPDASEINIDANGTAGMDFVALDMEEEDEIVEAAAAAEETRDSVPVSPGSEQGDA